MTTKHTSCPWEAIVYDGAFDQPLITSGHGTIGRLHGLEDRQHEANAKLIAAAPELLESEIKNLEFLRWITTQLSSFNMYSDKRELLYQRIAATEEAIKKATL